jgi:general L-amino acid transport system substrate-binding protein
MVPSKGKIKSAKPLKGTTACVQSGTTTEKNLTDFSRANKLDIKPVVFEKVEAAIGAYFAGRCQSYTTDASGLASVPNKEAKNPDDHIILPELISKEPLGPSVRRGDDEWFAIAKWVFYGLLEAEEYGITRANVDPMKGSTDPVVLRTKDFLSKILGH